jgi:hypothetical protein
MFREHPVLQKTSSIGVIPAGSNPSKRRLEHDRHYTYIVGFLKYQVLPEGGL